MQSVSNLPPSFHPSVSMSTLALTNLSVLHYARFLVAHSNVDFPPARFLMHGIRGLALPIVAATHVAKTLPAAISAVVAEGKDKVLWVFATQPVVEQVQKLLHPAFNLQRAGKCHDLTQDALVALKHAVRRTLHMSMREKGAVILRDRIILTEESIQVALTLTVTNPDNVIVGVAVRKSKWRTLTDWDFPVRDHTPVIVAPTATQGFLVPRPPAGDALAETVVERWREAGLLPFTQLSDPVVVFVRIAGVDVPFPRSVLLTTKGKHIEKGKKRLEPRKEKQKFLDKLKSRKRPRSPTGEELPNNQINHHKIQQGNKLPPSTAVDPFKAFAETLIATTPTATSINNVLRRKKEQNGAKDPTPVLLHPAAEQIVPPEFIEGGEDHHHNENPNPDQQNADPAQSLLEEKKEHHREDPTAHDKVENLLMPKNDQPTKVMDSSDGIDEFLLSASGPQTSFDNVGPSMDMTDFTNLAEDVEQYFVDPIPESNGGLGPTDEVGMMTQQPQDLSAYRLPDDETALLGGADPTKSGKDSKMDVDTDVEKTPKAKNDNEFGLRFGEGVINMTLSTLRAATVQQERPDEKALGSKLNEFFERDLTDRRLVRLRAKGSIGKKTGAAKLRKKRTFVRLNRKGIAATSGKSMMVSGNTSTLTLTSDVAFKLTRINETTSEKDVYVPRRKIKAYTSLRKSGRIMSPNVSLSDYESDSGDESDTQELPSVTAFKPNPGLTSMFAEQKMAIAATKSSGDAHSDLHPMKLLQTVAVDCASACMVLASMNNEQVHQANGTSSNGNTQSSETNGYHNLQRDEEASKNGGPLSTDPKTHANNATIVKSPAILQNGSPLSRATTVNKRDREILSIFALLEMQAFAAKELCLFREDAVLSDNARGALNAMSAKAGKLIDEHVPATTVRRVLLGLPRLLETSRTLGACAAAMREHDADSPLMRVHGPLSVNDMYSDSAKVFALSPPRVCVGFKNDWIETSCDVLPLWEKTGLEPYSEKKDVEYIAVAPKELDADAKLFLRDVSAAYEECSFGKHSAMAFGAVHSISTATRPDRNRGKQPDVLSESDKAMTEQYRLFITGICTKIASVAKVNRKDPNGGTKNIVVYIVSPFENSESAATVALLKAIAPLVHGVPGTVPTMVSLVAPSPQGLALPSAPWRCSSSSKSVVSLTVRVIPREVVDRQLSGHAEIESLLKRPLRPQIVKAVSFSVFSSIRSKRVKASQNDGEVAGMLARASLPDNLMSPMTPEVLAGSPGGGNATPVSPKGSNNDESIGSPISAAHGMPYADQGSALAPSFLHEPAVVLSGVGAHIGQTDVNASIVLHLSYALCESLDRYSFVWTDQRGEALDIATVPVSRVFAAGSRRKAFWCMWTRGQRWKISYVGNVHATVTKVGAMNADEVRDWDWVMSKVMQTDKASAEKRADDTPCFNVVQRFPPIGASQGDEGSDVYTDHPTPATPNPSQPTSMNNQKSNVSLDIKLPAVSSITILDVTEPEKHMFLENARREDDDKRRDFAVVSESPLSERKDSQACALLVTHENDRVGALELNLLRHYGRESTLEDMSDDRSPWDSGSADSIARSIVLNFHELRFVCAPPSWPYGRWQSRYPVHVDIARRLRMQMACVARFATPTGKQ